MAYWQIVRNFNLVNKCNYNVIKNEVLHFMRRCSSIWGIVGYKEMKGAMKSKYPRVFGKAKSLNLTNVKAFQSHK